MDSQKKITATVCIYSGRPNPQWEIAAKEYDKLLLTIESLPEAEPQRQPSVLGYAGITVRAGAKKIFCFNEVITVTNGNSERGYEDAKRVMERQLLHTAPLTLLDGIKGLLPAALK